MRVVINENTTGDKQQNRNIAGRLPENSRETLVALHELKQL